MKMLFELPLTVLPGTFAVPAGAQLRSVADDLALTRIWDETGACFGYPKPDGWRMQIHKMGNEVRLFSRSSKDWTAEFPTIVQMIREHLQGDVVLDTEFVGFDAHGSHLGPSLLREADHYHCYLLDALYLNGESIINLPTRRRIRLIGEYLSKALYGAFTLIEYTSLNSVVDLECLYQHCRLRKKEGFDGAIIKPLDTPYYTDVFKLKPTETIDAVVVGAEKNKQREIKTLLLAVRSHKRECWVPIAKVSKGNTDWNTVWSACEPCVQNHRPESLDDPPTIPNVWIAPKVVVTFTATLLERTTGYQIHAQAARNCVLREDKSPDEATSFEQLLEIANLNEYTKPNTGNHPGSEGAYNRFHLF